MAITRLNSLAIPAGTVETADLSYPLTNFSSTGIDDNATSTAITIDSSENVGIGRAPSTALNAFNYTVFEVAGKATNRSGALVLSTSNGTTYGQIYADDSVGWNFVNSQSGKSTAFYGSSGEHMRIDSSGNVMVGTTSASSNVAGIGGEFLTFTHNNGLIIGRSGASTQYNSEGLYYNTVYSFNYGTSEKARFDASGNFGIGVIPESWATYTPIQVQQASLASFTNGDARLTNNGYYNSGWKYIDSRYATQYLMDASNGIHTWSTAASGSADGAITWSERMRIDNSGNIGIGTSSPNARLNVQGAYCAQLTLQDNATNSTAKGGTLTGAHYTNTEEPVLIAASYTTATENIVYVGGGWSAANAATIISFRTAANNTTTSGTERMRINSSGYVGIGTSSPTVGLELSGAGNSTRIKLINGSDQFNFGLWDNSNYRLEGDANRKILITSYHTDGIHLGGSGSSNLVVKGGKVGIGTSSPSVPLDILGTGLNLFSGSLFHVRTKTSTVGQGILLGYHTGTGYGGLIAGDAVGGSENNLIFGGYSGSVWQEVMRIKGGGNVGIGTSSPGNQLHVVGGIRFSGSGADANRWNVYWNGSTGDLIVVSSDARLKKDFDYDIAGIETVNKLKPVRFTWKENNKRQLGFTAQESFEADEHLAWNDTENDQWGLDGWEGYAAVLTKAIQEQQAIIETLQAEVAALKGA